MAINVNTVYKTVLLILNKEQRGYVTPDEFNKIAAQVQLETFEQYGEDLNQQLRVPQTDTDYADRVAAIDEHLSIFKTSGVATFVPAAGTVPAHFSLPTTDIYSNTVDLYRLGVVNYKEEVELQRLQRMDFYNIQKSPLTKSTESFPTYLLESDRIFVKPSTIVSSINCDFLRKPIDPRWGYSIGGVGQYVYDPTVYGINSLNNTGTLSNFTTLLTGGTIGSYTPTFTTTNATPGTFALSAEVTSSTTVTVTITDPGSGFVVGDTITITSGQLGGGSAGPIIQLVASDFNANSTYGSTQIELDVSEQTSFILKTLFYFGVVVKDPQIIQVAASQIQQEEGNKKS